MIPRSIYSSAPATTEAVTRADLPVHRRPPRTAVLTPNDGRLVQHAPGKPVHVLAGPADVFEQAVGVQHRMRSPRSRA